MAFNTTILRSSDRIQPRALLVPDPSPFDGSERDVAQFVDACKHKIASCPGTSSELALAFIASLFVDDAASWYLSSLPIDGSILDVFADANDFLAAITRHFSRPVAAEPAVNARQIRDSEARQAAANKLRRLRQRGSIQAFNAQFNAIARHSQYNDVALLVTWQRAIKPYLLKAMLPGQNLSTLCDWQKAAIAVEESYNHFYFKTRHY